MTSQKSKISLWVPRVVREKLLKLMRWDGTNLTDTVLRAIEYYYRSRLSDKAANAESDLHE